MKKKTLIIFLIIFIFLLLIIGTFSFILLNNIISKNENISYDNIILPDKSEINNIEPEEKEAIEVILPNKKDITVSMTAIGDIMCHNTQFKDAYSNGVYDFSYVFSDIETKIQEADISIGNLETTFAGSARGYGGYPNFNTPEALATDLNELGIDVLTTANNHSLDTGYSGLESTINFLNNAGISHTGTSCSAEEQNTILYKNVNGLKFAFLAFTYGTNGISIPNGKEYCINLINTDFIFSQLELAKLEKPDVICVSMHWGEEYSLKQNQTQIDLSNFLFENGVDIILGSHPHVLEPFEKKNITLPDGTEKEVFVIYSMGNFMSGQTQANTKTSIILNLKLTKHGNTGKLSIDKLSYTPIYTYTYPKYKNYKIINLKQAVFDYENDAPNRISYENYLNFKSELEKVNSMLN